MSLAVLGLTVVGPASQPAAAWDSFPTWADSHRAITERALLGLALDGSLPRDFRLWVVNNTETLIDYSTRVPWAKRGELVHGTERPIDQPVDLSGCEPRDDLEDKVTGAARWAVGNNPGETHPEYWWNTAVCLWRSGHRTEATQVLAQLMHSVSDQGAPPHAFYKMHGGITGQDQFFEWLSALTPYDNSYYKKPDSVFFPGKNVLDVADHGDREWVTFHIPKRTGWTPIRLSPRSADSKPTYLQTPSATHVRLDFSVKELTAFPKIGVAVLYERADGSRVYRDDITVQLATSPIWAHVDLYDHFAPNGRLWISFNRTEKAYRTSTGQLQVYVASSNDMLADAAKPALTHPWEYYEWLREWTQWNMDTPYWRRYFPNLDAGGMDFDVEWVTAPNSERALLTLQWAMSEQVTKWFLEDAYTLLNDPAYTLDETVGQGYRVAFYNDHDYNSSRSDDESPENIISYAIGCEPYPGEKCRSYVAPAFQDAHATVGDGLFTASGTGEKVTMKANKLPPMLNQKISSLEVRGATVYLYPGQDLTGQPVVVSGDTRFLGDFNDRTQSIRIVPDGVTDPPTARDDYAFGPSNAPITIPVLDNDSMRDPSAVTIALRPPRHGEARVEEGKIVYSPDQEFTAPWPLEDSFTYELTENATGFADTGRVTVNVGGVNHPPRDVALDVLVGGEPVTSADEGQQVTATASFVDEDLGDTHRATVSWGDGSPDIIVSVPAGAGQFEATHVYRDNSAAGAPFQVRTTVSDAAGASAADSTTLEVLNVAPAVSITSVMAGRPFTPVGIEVPLAGAFTDPGELDTHAGSVDWGNGTVEQLGAVSRDGIEARHAYAAPGTFSVRLVVVDDDGGRGTASVSAVILSPAQASERLAQMLKDLMVGQTQQDTVLLQAAIDQLGSRHDGRANNGASDKFAAGDVVAGLVKLGKVEQALRAVTGPDVSVERLLVAQVALSVAQQAVQDARESTGCVDDSAAGCWADDAGALQRIEEYMSMGRAAMSAGRYLAAIDAFQSATSRAVALRQ